MDELAAIGPKHSVSTQETQLLTRIRAKFHAVVKGLNDLEGEKPGQESLAEPKTKPTSAVKRAFQDAQIEAAKKLEIDLNTEIATKSIERKQLHDNLEKVLETDILTSLEAQLEAIKRDCNDHRGRFLELNARFRDTKKSLESTELKAKTEVDRHTQEEARWTNAKE